MSHGHSGNRSQVIRVFTFIVLLVAAGFLGARINDYLNGRNSFTRPVFEKEAVAQSRSSAPSEAHLLKRSSESFRAVARMVNPSVVVIKSTIEPSPRHHVRGRRGPHGEEPYRDPFFDFFFRQFGGGPFDYQGPEAQQQPQTALGSGFIIDKRGYIVTNNHVVKGANKVVVNLPGQEQTDITAKVVGTDPRSDLAVLKIDHRGDLPTVQWADSDQVEVGDWAIAIGSPFMLSHTVTVGIVSAKGRSASNVVGSDYGYEMLQTDAAINPGNSGGPLCTIDGKVMGVNTAIFTESGGYMGIGFAIPSNLAKNIVDTLSHGGKVVRGYLGVSIQPLDESMLKELGVKGGALVHEVTPGSPARKSGIKPGDVIVDFNGKPVNDPSELQRLVSQLKPGQKVSLRLINYDSRKTRNVEVTIGQLPDREASSEQSGPKNEEEAGPDALGLAVSPAPGGKGVQVEGVAPESIGALAGFQQGDIILSINRHPVNSPEEYRKLTSSAKRRLNILIQRGDQQLFFGLDVPNGGER